MTNRLIVLASAAALAIGSITGCSTTSKPADATPAAKKQSIDAAVDAALAQLYAQDPAARELVAKARGTLVFPSVVSAGFVVGGSYGEGALRSASVNDRIPAPAIMYYKTAVFILFMTQEALDKFKASNGWTVGADASVSMMKVGANAGVDTSTAQSAVIGYVLTKGGLMANLSLAGTKITPLEL